MPVFKAIKVLYVHIPKTAGTSIEHTLYHYEPAENFFAKQTFYGQEPDYWSGNKGYSLQHYTIRDLASALGVLRMAWFEIIFASVRNPYYRMVSEFHFYHEAVMRRPIKSVDLPDLQSQFGEFCRQLIDKKITNDGHERPQYEYLCLELDPIEPKLDPRIKILYFEHIEPQFLDLFGYPLQHHVQESKRAGHLPPYADYYVESTRCLVAHYYRHDFALLGYNIDDPRQEQPLRMIVNSDDPQTQP